MPGDDRADSPAGRIRPRTIVERAELFDLIAADPEAIEPGLRLIEREFDITRHDRVDALLADASGRPVFVVADVQEREHFPLTAIDLRRAARRSAPLLARLFSGLDFGRTPRVLV